MHLTCHPFTAYDIRGHEARVTADLARTVAMAFVQLTHAATIVVARDMRPTSPALAAAFIDGALYAGADVVDLGLGTTDMLYFASGLLDLPGAMITASHNPAGDNGIKLVGAGASPIARDTGLADIHAFVHTGRLPGRALRATRRTGAVTTRDLRPSYTARLRDVTDLAALRPMTVVIDAGNGMASHVLPGLLKDLPLDVVPLYFDLDGTFPHHPADPMNPANLTDLQAAVTEYGADLGLAFDGDADRCFLIDDRGHPVPPTAVLAWLAERELARNPGAAVVHDLLTSTATIDAIRHAGGRPFRSPVGHAFVKLAMERHDAILGGEASGHYYWRDLYYADSGPLTALHILAALSASDLPLSRRVAEYTRYASSGEVNFHIPDPGAALAAVEAAYAASAELDHLDGLTAILGPGTWFNLRPSAVEPVVRLTVEAPTASALARLHGDVADILNRRESALRSD